MSPSESRNVFWPRQRCLLARAEVRLDFFSSVFSFSDHAALSLGRRADHFSANIFSAKNVRRCFFSADNFPAGNFPAEDFRRILFGGIFWDGRWATANDN